MVSVPRLSVVMPVRNAAPYLDAAVESILGQSFVDFEFVAVDDGSTDGSTERLAAWAARDARLRVERSDEPLGLAGSSNRAVRASRAPIVARMDADDVSAPERLARQLDVLDREAGAVLVGTLFEGIDAAGRRVRARDRWRLLRPSPFAPFPHGSIMFRRDAYDAVGGYDPRTEYWEDLDFVRRLATRGRVFVIPDALYRYRFHATNVRLTERRQEVERAVARMRQTVDPTPRRAARADVTADAADDPRVLYSLAASRLWAGRAPGLWPRLRWRALATGDPGVIGIFGIAAAAAVSPRATRTALAAFIAVRDRLAGLRLDGAPREWHFV